MDNFYDDFDDDFDDSDDSMEDRSYDDFGPEDSLDNDIGIEDEPMGDDQCDDEFTTKEAVIFGMAMNFAYEEGLEEAERRKLEKKMQDDRDKRNNRS
jgi:hypothetical protein